MGVGVVAPFCLGGLGFLFRNPDAFPRLFSKPTNVSGGLSASGGSGGVFGACRVSRLVGGFPFSV